MLAGPDELRSAVDALVGATVRTVIEVAGDTGFDAVERAYLGRERPADLPPDDARWWRGCWLSTLLLGPLLQALDPVEREVEHLPDPEQAEHVRQLVDDAAAQLAQLVGDRPDAAMSITDELYGDDAPDDPSEHNLRDVTIWLFASQDLR